MKLKVLQIDKAKPKDKPYKLADGGSMYLEVMPNGSKYWRLKYTHLGKEKRYAIGVYPDVSLPEAREERERLKKIIKSGIDPMEQKRAKEREALIKAANSFEAVALEWLEKQSQKWQPKTADKIRRYLENDLFPELGNRPIADIDPPELLFTLRKIEDRGAYYQAGRIKQICGQIFRYGVATGRNPRDPTADLKGALTPSKKGHYASLTLKELPDFLKALEQNYARLFPQTRRGMKLLMLTMVRTSELILSQWDEIDLEKGIWEIPAERMKMGRPHIVPLSKQVIDLFEEQKKETAHINTPWIFPNQVRPQKPMSNNTILFGIKRLGYQGRMTGHGFRSLAMTTLMEELGHSFDIVDAQLAHAKGDNTRRAYDRTQYLPQRTKMMQEWSDYIETLTIGGKIIPAQFGNA